MQVLITGAETPLGRLAASALAPEHATVPAAADYRDPAAPRALVAGVGALLHLEPYALAEGGLPDAELLDRAARGTYHLLHAALAAGVRRVVLASRLELLAAYGAAVLPDETWRPAPAPEAAALAPYLAELTVREFVRAEALEAVCLRLGPLGEAPEGTTEADAAAALRRALVLDPAPSRHRWWLAHVCSGGRYPRVAFAQPPFAGAGSGEA